MKKKRERSLDKHFRGFTKIHQNENSENRNPNTDDSYDKKRPPIKEEPITVGPHHPHYEEILDGMPY